jgi:hypothetical protein
MQSSENKTCLLNTNSITLRVTHEEFEKLCLDNLEIYRWEQDVEVLRSPITLSGENLLPGFILDLTAFWSK